MPQRHLFRRVGGILGRRLRHRRRLLAVALLKIGIDEIVRVHDGYLESSFPADKLEQRGRSCVEAMVTAGDIPSDVVARAGRYWEWLIIGAIFDAAKHPGDRRTIESNLVDVTLRILGLEDARIVSLLERLRSSGGGRRTRSATAKP